MDEPPSNQTPRRSQSIWSYIGIKKAWKVIWAWIRRGWAAISGLGLFQLEWISRNAAGIWHHISTLDTAKDIYTVLGGNASMLMSFISNPFFGVCLIILGMTGIPAAKSEAMSGQLIPSRQPFGWILFSGLAIIVFSTLWFESYMLSSGALAIREFYIAQHTPREVRKEQLTLIELNVCPFAEEFQPVRVIAVHTTEAMHYAQEFISAFKACPISVIDFGGMDQSFPIPTETADLHRKGLFVAVNNKDAPDARSKAFLEHLLAANIDVKFSQFEGKTPPPPQAPVTLFISDR